ncbi:hypothetical protein [Leptospira weilii]|uniref:hypothetical protein n=1 Tax=Leptospira weilii TaxID=28184 RepID=UPI0002BF26EF|nr:hypothetical protein [Leptospira weilii]EMN45193.1 hypothetical protein LEP1GSC086_1277 [Leptospira weilii str. LNT 1234]
MHSLRVYFRSCLSPIYVQTVFKIQESELSVLKDDRLAFGMGTKFRKFLGIHFALEKKNIRNVILQGELHSNALAAFSFLFYNFGYKVHTICYARDQNKTSANSIFVRRNSHCLKKYNSRSEWKKKVFEIESEIAEEFEIIKNTDENGVLIPEYGFCRGALDGLDSLWGQIPIERYDRLVIDLGSGTTWLSANRFFQNRIPVIGVCIGLSKKKMLVWLNEKKTFLDLKTIEIDENQIIDSKIRVGFGSRNIEILEYCKSFYEKYKIPIEPIYSGKTLYEIEALIRSGQWNGRTLYLHQGGLWNFLDSFSLPKFKS